MKKKWLARTLLVVSFFTSGWAYAQNPTIIRIASPDLSAGAKHAGGGAVDVLSTKKYLEKEFAKDNIKVQWFFFKGAGPAINEAIANNQIDFAFLGDLPPIVAKARGLNTQLLVPTARGISNYLVVRSDLNIKNFSELKGKRVGILRGTADELSFNAALKSQGLKASDVRLINLDFNAINAALVAKKIDATWGPSRYFALRDKGIVKLPVSSRTLNGAGATQGVFLGTADFINKYPQVTQRVVNQVVQALYWLSQEKNRVPQIALFYTQSNYPPSVYAQELHGVNFHFLYSPWFDQYYLGRLKQNVDLAKQQGLIRGDININSWVNPKFVQQALTTLNLKNEWKPTANYEYLKK
ncbi:MAG: ABC transporter substrate-binding protein [Acinetobacter sp.]